MKQIKNKERVASHGEVFTNAREVNSMLDLVKQETQRIDSRFLEPTCGEGVFLKEILRRKLHVVGNKYKKNPFDYEKYAILALTSIYGVDILEDNAEICRNNLFDMWNTEYSFHTKNYARDVCRKVARYILEKNILCGDALSMKKNDGTPIIFSEWSLVTGNCVKRRDYRFDELLDGYTQQTTIFMNDWEYDEDISAFIPKPIKEFPPIDYIRLVDYD